jgi:hypothetical protein
LLWLNVDDAALDDFIARGTIGGWPIRVIGRTPDNIGMRAYPELFRAAQYPQIVQIDDDVLRVSHGVAELADRIFTKHPRVRQIVADVWQDEFTTGARPPLQHYRIVDETEGLLDGPIDGWFSIYHRSILPLLVSLPGHAYACIGGTVRNQLARVGQQGVLCTRMKVFHAVGPAYASLFGMLDFEVEKYRRLGRPDIVHWYQSEVLPSHDALASRFATLSAILDQRHDD